MKEEIMHGIKSAMERGSGLEQAGQSFINAGYNEKEVREAINMLSGGGVTEIIAGRMPDASDFDKKELPSLPAIKKKRGKVVVILMIVLIVMILGILGVMTYYLLKP